MPKIYCKLQYIGRYYGLGRLVCLTGFGGLGGCCVGGLLSSPFGEGLNSAGSSRFLCHPFFLLGDGCALLLQLCFLLVPRIKIFDAGAEDGSFCGKRVGEEFLLVCFVFDVDEAADLGVQLGVVGAAVELVASD